MHFLQPYPRSRPAPTGSARPLAAATNTHSPKDKLTLKHKQDKRPHARAKLAPAFPSKAMGAGAEKAKPTVSVTSANASRAGDKGMGDVLMQYAPRASMGRPRTSVHNAVPFPSAPIPFPASRDDPADDAMDCCETSPHATSAPESVTAPLRPPTSVPQKRTRASLSFPPLSEDRSTLHPDAHEHAQAAACTELPSVRRARLSPAADPEQLVPRSHGAAGRRGSMSAGSAAPSPPTKRARRGKRAATDLHFVAKMHRSIVCHVLSMPGADDALLDAVVAQEGHLVERLWKSLLDQGCTPVPLPSANALSPESQTDDVDMTAPSPATDANHDAAGPYAGSACPPESGLDVLTMPQLVAALVMRHRDRATTRIRAKSRGDDAGPVERRRRSPLSQLLCSAQEGDDAKSD